MKFKKIVFDSIKTSISLELVFSLLYTLCISLIPYIQKLLFDSNGHYSMGYLVLIYMLLILGSAIFQYISQFNEWKRDRSFVITTKDIIFKSIFGKPYYNFKERTVGDYITITNDTIEAIEEEYLSAYIDIIKAVGQIIIYMISIIVIVDFRIALIIILSSLSSVFLPRITADRLAKKRKQYQDQFGYYTDVINDFYIGNVGLDDASKDGIITYHETILEQTEDKKLKFGKFKTFVNIVNGFIMDLVSLTAFIAVGYFLYKGEITVGAGVATFAYIESFIYPIKYILNDINAINASKELVVEVNNLGEDYINNLKITSKNEPINEIESVKIVDVCYGINDFKFGPVNFEFQQGMKYLIIGTSGAGKTTLLKLFSGQIKADYGKILFNNKDVSDNLNEYSSNHIMFITQSSHIFSVPFLEQVTHFNAYSSEKLDYYLNKLPDDIRNRLVNCKNCNQLSGGEKQVLNILTCALAQKPITIVDEGLSAMDYNTKQIVRKEILSKINTNIYIEIAHSTEFETIDFFDQLLEMKKGRVINVYSKHEYLMANFRE